MLTIHPQYLTDDKGKKLSVVLPMDEFEKLLAQLEEQEDIRLYDEVKALNEPSVPFEKAFERIEANRKKNGV